MEMFDDLSLMRNKKPLSFGEVCVYQKTLGEIEEFGYENYQNFLYTIITESVDVADILWFENKVWYEDIKSEWNFFVEKASYHRTPIEIEFNGNSTTAMRIDDIYRDALNYFLGIDGEYIIMDKKKEDETEALFYNVKKNSNGIYELNLKSFKFTHHYYEILKSFLKTTNCINIKYNFLDGGNKRTKIYILKQKYKDRKKKQKETITMSSIVSSLIAKANNYETIWNYPIYMIYNQYHRYIKLDDWDNTMKALHSGCIDTTANPIDWDKINWSGILNN